MNFGNGALTEAVYYILLSLMQPLHGYGIMQNAEELSHGRVKLAAGTLYGAINTMLEKGWITALPGEKNSRKKEYALPWETPTGAHDIYKTGEYMIWTDHNVYKCLSDTNFSPADYPAAWELA